MMKTIISDNQAHSHIPDYIFELDGDLVKIHPRKGFSDVYKEAESPRALDKIMLKQSTPETARKLSAGYDNGLKETPCL